MSMPVPRYGHLFASDWIDRDCFEGLITDIVVAALVLMRAFRVVVVSEAGWDIETIF